MRDLRNLGDEVVGTSLVATAEENVCRAMRC